MKAKTMLSVVGLAVSGVLALALLLVSSGRTGEYHSGANLICFDCHTMHYSESQGASPTDPYGTGTTVYIPLAGGPNQFLLRQPANQLCLACHDGKTFAPDVLGANANASPSQGRQAGALNDAAGAAPYQTWKGHTLDSPVQPPGWNPTAVGITAATWYNGGSGPLECISCHAQHGPASAYRNLGSYALGAVAANFRPTYSITTTQADALGDVWINIAAGYVAGTGNAATFNPYYDRANTFFRRIDATVGSVKTSNKIGSFCAACHANFHGGPGDTNIGATVAALDGFIRHPTAQVTIGAAGAQGYGGHSNLPRYVGATTKVKVATTNWTTYADATPLCVTCHKSHGNQNPFGLIFLNRAATSVGEEGGWGTTEAQNTAQGLRNLCGQCHGQGN